MIPKGTAKACQNVFPNVLMLRYCNENGWKEFCCELTDLFEGHNRDCYTTSLTVATSAKQSLPIHCLAAGGDLFIASHFTLSRDAQLIQSQV